MSGKNDFSDNDNKGDKDPDGDGTPPDAAAVAAAERQAELNRIAAREKEQGRRSGVEGLLSKLGFASAEEAEAAVKKMKDEEASRLSETEKAQKAAIEAAKVADAAKSEAQNILLNAKKIEALVGEKMTIDEASLLIDLIKVPDDADKDAIVEAIAELKTKMPKLFSAAEPDPKKLPNSNPGNRNVGGKPADDAGTKTRELLFSRHPHLNKKD